MNHNIVVLSLIIEKGKQRNLRKTTITKYYMFVIKTKFAKNNKEQKIFLTFYVVLLVT